VKTSHKAHTDGITLLKQGKFENLLQTPLLFSLRDDDIIQFIYNFPNSKNAFLAAVIIVYDKTHLLESLKTLQPNNTLFTDYILTIKCFYHFDVFPIIYYYAPLLMPALLATQKRHFKPHLITINDRELKLFTIWTKSHFRLNEADYMMAYMIDFFYFAHPSSHSFRKYDAVQYCRIIIKTIRLYNPKSSFLTSHLSELVLSLPNEWIEPFYDNLQREFFHNRSELSQLNDIFTLIFSNSLLASLAFKKGDPFFLSFCDLPTLIKKHPEYFVS